jgi:polyhydroxyalkanoate synthesis regulator phasin
MSTDDKAGDKDPKSARQKVGDGIRQGIGVLSAFKDALEETIQEARERGDLSTDRAKEVMKGALGRAQAAAAEARERLDLVNQGDLEAVQGALDSLKQRIVALESSVFGASKDEEEAPPKA